MEYLLLMSNVVFALLMCLALRQTRIAQRNTDKAIKAAKTAQSGWQSSIQTTKDCLDIIKRYKI